MNQEQLIRETVMKAGCPCHIKGFLFLVEAITIALKDATAIYKMTTFLYPTIGEKYASNGPRVERAIRHAIEVAWSQPDYYQVLTELLGVRIGDRKMTNSEFIATITERIRFQLDKAVS